MIAFDVALTALAEAILNTTDNKTPVIFVRKKLGDGDFNALQEAVRESSTSTPLKSH